MHRYSVVATAIAAIAFLKIPTAFMFPPNFRPREFAVFVHFFFSSSSLSLPSFHLRGKYNMSDFLSEEALSYGDGRGGNPHVSAFFGFFRHPSSPLHFPNLSTNSASEIIGIPSSFAFLFFPDVDSTSLFTRKFVLDETEPATFPPLASTDALNSFLLA